MIKRFIIYGERCSGTNYLQELIELNFDVETTWDYGWKHFFGFNDVSKSDNTLFVCIVRDPYTWINSMYRIPHHITHTIRGNPHKFLNNEIFSFDDHNENRDETKEKMEDRHIYTNERYKNIFELRYTKLHYLTKDLPAKVKHYIFIRYEDLLYDFDNTMNRLKKTGLKVKPNIVFPINTKYDIKVRNQTEDRRIEPYRENNHYPISKELVYLNPHFDFAKEYEIGYFQKNAGRTSKI
jgi:hypothetical protein